MTTEFWAYLGAVAAVAIAALLTNGGDGSTFAVDRAMLYISLLTIGYMLSRGLAKAGSGEPQDNHSHGDRRE